MTYRVDGSGSDAFQMYMMSALARWDDTGTLLSIAEATYSEGNGGVATAAGALWAIAVR